MLDTKIILKITFFKRKKVLSLINVSNFIKNRVIIPTALDGVAVAVAGVLVDAVVSVVVDVVVT